MRIDDAFRSSTMTDCARDVLAMLERCLCIGRFHSMRIADMQRGWMHRGEHVWCERSIKSSVKELVETHGVPVGSSRTYDNSGYFFISSSDDIEAAERPLRGEMLSLARRLRTINPKSDFARHIAGQIELESSEVSQ